MSLLQRDPGAEVGSPAELAAIARTLRQGVARRYAELARRFERRGDSAAAQVFRRLAEKADAAAGEPRSAPAPLPPELAGPWEELAASTLVTPYRALAQAVRAADSSFAYASYLAARARDPATRAAAEELAEEALRHAAALRRLRREAWRRERARRPSPPRPRTPEALARAARALLAEAAAVHAALADAAATAGEAEQAEAMRELAAGEARDAGIPPPPAAALPRGLSPEQRRERALAPLETLFELHEAAAARATSETMLAAAQAGLEAAAERLQRLAAVL